MPRSSLRLVAGLAALAGVSNVLTAEEAGAAPRAGTAGTAPAAMGRGAQVFGQQSERQVYIQGLVDVDYISQNNYTDGDSDISDDYQGGLIRAELGARVELDERVEIKVTVAYDAETGDHTWDGTDTDDANLGNAVIDDAYMVFKEFLGQPQLGLKAGRQPVAWNLRTEYGAFLYDSRADDRDVTSWDGARVSYALETITITPYVFSLPDESRLYGAAIDWQPAEGAGNGLFLTGSANAERDVTLAGLVPGTGRTLFTYYGGAEVKFDNGIDLYAEGAVQRGREDSDVDFGGYAFSGGIEWHPPTTNQMAFGIQADHFSGDTDPADDTNRTFIRNWEGMGDTYIVESEKYGELSRVLQGNLQALKVRAEFAIDRTNRFRVKLVFGEYRLVEEVGDEDGFGRELDLTLSWQYTDNATINLLGGVFEPGDAFIVAPATPGDNDLINVFAANLQVAF